MWTCDLIKALTIMEADTDGPVCFERVFQPIGSSLLVFEFSPSCAYTYDTNTGILKKVENRG